MSNNNSKLSIGFIGLGLMGAPMTKRFLDAGFVVHVWNRSIDKLTPLVTDGAVACSSIANLVRKSEIVMLCVSDTHAVEQVIFGHQGIASVASENKILLDFSSIDPKSTIRFAEKLQLANGMSWIDAPVSGGVVGAESGTLVVMAGGEKKQVESLREILSVVAKRITYMGPIGSGQTTKICNQILVSCNVLVMAEVLALAEKSGVDSTKIPKALAGVFADSIPLQLTGTRMVNKDFDDIKWHVKTLLKDLNMSNDLARENATDNPIANLAQQLMQNFVDEGFGDKDPSSLIKPYLE